MIRRLFTAFVFAAGVSCGAEPELIYLNPKGTEEACFRHGSPVTLRLSGFAPGTTLEVEFVSVAPPTAPAPNQPAVRATTAIAHRWLQVVQINIPPSSPPPKGTLGHQLIDKPFPWLFADTSDGNRARGVPFYWDEATAGGQRPFFDNPAWGVPTAAEQPKGERHWEASCFAVRVVGRTITAVGGFRWGYRWRVGAATPTALQPEALSPESWAGLLPLLALHYKEWSFQ